MDTDTMFSSLGKAIEYLRYIHADLSDCIDFVNANHGLFDALEDYHRQVSHINYSDFEFATVLWHFSKKSA